MSICWVYLTQPSFLHIIFYGSEMSKLLKQPAHLIKQHGRKGRMLPKPLLHKTGGGGTVGHHSQFSSWNSTFHLSFSFLESRVSTGISTTNYGKQGWRVPQYISCSKRLHPWPTQWVLTGNWWNRGEKGWGFSNFHLLIGVKPIWNGKKFQFL